MSQTQAYLVLSAFESEYSNKNTMLVSISYQNRVCLHTSDLIPSLHLMIASHGLGVRWRNSRLTTTAASLHWPSGWRSVVVPCPIRSLIDWWCHHSSRTITSIAGPGGILWHSPLRPVGTLNNHICDSVGLGVLWDGVVVGVWELRDNVPGVEQAGQETEHAEEDVYEGVGRADTALDPDYQGVTCLFLMLRKECRGVFGGGSGVTRGVMTYQQWEGTGWR